MKFESTATTKSATLKISYPKSANVSTTRLPNGGAAKGRKPAKAMKY